MGAGKGRVKRTRTQTAQVNKSAIGEVAYNANSWDEFLSASGIGETDARIYYLGDDIPEWDESDYEKILNELFQDALASGTIVLPEGYDKEDFEIVVKEAPQLPQLVFTNSKQGYFITEEVRVKIPLVADPIGCVPMDGASVQHALIEIHWALTMIAADR